MLVGQKKEIEERITKDGGSAYTIRKGKSLDYALHRIVLAQSYEISKGETFLSAKDVQLAIFLLLKSFRSKNRSSKSFFYDSYEEIGRKFTEYTTVDFENISYPDGESIKKSLEKLEELEVISVQERNRKYKDGRLGPMGIATMIKVIKTAKFDIRDLIGT